MANHLNGLYETLLIKCQIPMIEITERELLDIEERLEEVLEIVPPNLEELEYANDQLKLFFKHVEYLEEKINSIKEQLGC